MVALKKIETAHFQSSSFHSSGKFKRPNFQPSRAFTAAYFNSLTPRKIKKYNLSLNFRLFYIKIFSFKAVPVILYFRIFIRWKIVMTFIFIITIWMARVSINDTYHSFAFRDFDFFYSLSNKNTQSNLRKWIRLKIMNIT